VAAESASIRPRVELARELADLGCPQEAEEILKAVLLDAPDQPQAGALLTHLGSVGGKRPGWDAGKETCHRRWLPPRSAEARSSSAAVPSRGPEPHGIAHGPANLSQELRRAWPENAGKRRDLPGALRWAVMAATAWVPAILLVQPLHGLTFAAQHLAAMAILARVVPGRLAATAQSVYASLGTGLVGAALTLASGPLYAWLGAGGFWVMASLCALAVPASLALRAVTPGSMADGQSGPGWPPR